MLQIDRSCVIVRFFFEIIVFPNITLPTLSLFNILSGMYLVGDITTECKSPRRGRFTFNYIEAHEDPEDGALLMKLRGPEPKGGLGPIVVNRHSHVTCIVS